MKKIHSLRSVLIAFLLVLLALASCKKGRDDPAPAPSKTATFPQNSGTPGDLITIKTSFKLEKETSELKFGSKTTTASRLTDSTLAFFVPYVPSGKVEVDLSDAGISEPYQFTVNAYTPVANPAQVVAEFSTLLTETINDEEFSELSQPAAAIKESFQAKYQALSADEKAEVAFLIQKLYSYPELNAISSSGITPPRLLSAESSIGTRSSLKSFEVPGSITSDQHYRQTILQCGSLYVISGSALVIGANMMAAPGGVTQVAGAASLGFFFYTFGKALKCRRVLRLYPGEITTFSQPSIFELAGASNFSARRASSAPQTTALQSAGLDFEKNKSYRLSVDGSFKAMSSTSKSSVIQAFLSKLNEFASVYNKGIALVNKVKGWFIRTPDFPPFDPQIPEPAEEASRALRAEMLSIENISNKGISLALSGTAEQGVVKASSTTVNAEVEFSFDLVYKNSILDVTARETVRAVYDPSVYAHRLALESGNNQAPEPGKKLANPLRVIARDQEGKVLEGVKVEWKVKSGGGTLSVQESLTNAQGIAQAEWTPGTSGTQEVEAVSKKKDGTPVLGSPVKFSTAFSLTGKWKFTRMDMDGEPFLNVWKELGGATCNGIRYFNRRKVTSANITFNANNTGLISQNVETSTYTFGSACAPTSGPVLSNQTDNSSFTWSADGSSNVVRITSEGELLTLSSSHSNDILTLTNTQQGVVWTLERMP